MSDSKSVKMHYDVAGDDFDRAGEASAGLKRLLQKQPFFLHKALQSDGLILRQSVK